MATTPVDPPEATVVQVTSRSETSIDLPGTTSRTRAVIMIERSTDGESDWAAIGNMGQDVTMYSDVGLERHTYVILIGSWQ